MVKRFFCSILIFLMVLQFYALPAAAESTQTAEDTTQPPTVTTQPPTVATQPPTVATQPPEESTQPPTQSTQPPTESTQPSTESTQPPTQSTTEPTTAPTSCTHSYGAWSTAEAAHSRTCTKCGNVDSSGHSWYSETVTVAPTCKDGGGSAKVCTVCELILITEITPPLTTHTYTNACDTECNVCGVKRTTTHKYSTLWTFSGRGHWHTCTICGAAGEVKAHYPGPAATEEKEQICLTCGYVLMSKRGHVHDYSTQWSSDNAGHWYACSDCNELKEYAAHIYQDDCDADCDVCDYTRTAPHSYGADWQQTEQTHSGVCTHCGEKSAVEDHIANDAGTACAVCGYALKALEEIHVHSFDGAWEGDAAQHWQLCACGERRTEAHTWDTGKEADDVRVFTCKTCGIEKQEQLEESGFPWLLLLVGFVFVAALIGIIVCIVLLRRQGKYSR